MELQFDTVSCSCLRTLTREQQTTEQTQELKLPDDMPDIGRALGCWGQCIMRSKSWNGDHMVITGGIMAWVLYQPEDGSNVRSLETWIPYNLRWELPHSDREGTIHVLPQVLTMDVRTLSARKLMVRVCVGGEGSALVAEEVKIPKVPNELSDVEIKKSTYPAVLLMEAGEKNFLLEEDLDRGIMEDVEKLISCSVHPYVVEQKIVGNKLAFRGNANVHLVYESHNGKISSANAEIPYSQYTELDRDYGNDASAQIDCCVTSLETETREDGSVSLKCGMVGQYTIVDTTILELPEDAYSLRRELKLHMGDVEVPVLLEETEETISCVENTNIYGAAADVQFYPELPQMRKERDDAVVQLGGNFSVLHYDQDGNVQGSNVPYRQELKFPMDDHGEMYISVTRDGAPRAAGNVDAVLKCTLKQHTQILSRQTFTVITGMELGDPLPRDSKRPTLILQRMGSDTLWELAKCCGSTVEAICQTNNLDREPEESRMLLIPVL